jgi:hypothetical protein
MLARSLHQKRQNRPGVPGCINIARAQVTDQQVAATGDIEWQVAVVIVVAMEEAIFLLTCSGVSVASKSRISRLGGLS